MAVDPSCFGVLLGRSRRSQSRLCSWREQDQSHLPRAALDAPQRPEISPRWPLAGLKPGISIRRTDPATMAPESGIGRQGFPSCERGDARASGGRRQVGPPIGLDITVVVFLEVVDIDRRSRTGRRIRAGTMPAERRTRGGSPSPYRPVYSEYSIPGNTYTGVGQAPANSS